MKGILWRSGKPDSEPSTALIVKAQCAAGPCLILFFVLGGEKVVAIVPAQPSPLCMMAEQRLQRVIGTILSDVGFNTPYFSACRVSKSAIRESVRDTIQALIDYEVVRSVPE